jgi:hypothetical protein
MTAHSITISTTGETLSLTDGNPVNLRGQYIPAPSTGGENVRESFEIYINESSATNALNKIASINRLIELGRAWAQYGLRFPVYVLFNPAGVGSRRALLVDGLCKAGEYTLSTQVSNGKVIATIEWVRACYEAESATTLTCYRYGTSGTRLGITNSVDAYPDPSYSHHFWVAAAAVVGDFPAPAKLTITNDNGTGVIDEAYVSVAGYVAGSLVPPQGQHWQEGEDGTPGAGVVGTNTADVGNSSQDAYEEIVWTSAAETELLSWTVASGVVTMLRAFGKHGLAIRLKGGVAYTDLYLRFSLGVMDGATFVPRITGNLCKVPASTELVMVDVLDFGTYSGSVSSVNLGEHTLVLYGLKGDGTATTVNVDYFCFFPYSYYGGLVHLVAKSTVGVADGESLVIDTPEGENYRTTAGTIYHPEYAMRSGKGLYLFPGRDNYFYTLLAAGGNTDPNFASLVGVTYHPRYRTV